MGTKTKPQSVVRKIRLTTEEQKEPGFFVVLGGPVLAAVLKSGSSMPLHSHGRGRQLCYF